MGFPKGGHHSEQTKEKIRNANKGVPCPEERKEKIRKSKIGSHLSEETKQKLSSAFVGTTRSNEIKKKISDSIKGKNHPFYGKHHSENSRRKISESGKGRILSEEHKRKISESSKGKGQLHYWKGGISKDKEHLRLLGRIGQNKRTALEMNAEGNFTIGEWELLKRQYGYKCPLCNNKEPEIKLTIDHIIPLSKGGSNFIENVQPLCGPCNSKKHTKIFKVSPNGLKRTKFK